MIAKLCYVQRLALDLVHDSVFICNASGPISGESVIERFRFANAAHRTAPTQFTCVERMSAPYRRPAHRTAPTQFTCVERM